MFSQFGQGGAVLDHLYLARYCTLPLASSWIQTGCVPKGQISPGAAPVVHERSASCVHLRCCSAGAQGLAEIDARIISRTLLR